MSEKSTFFNIFYDLSMHGKLTSPRGELIVELENYMYELQPFERFQSFEIRKLNIDYIKAEFLWYLKGDKFDVSIAKRAKIWQNIINDNGSINSNYGHYIFVNGQFDTALKTLLNDKDTRRASIVILNEEHLSMKTNDVPCTYSISFRIRENKLNMSVRMRSQDAIYGMANDAPAFSFIHEMMFNALLTKYENLSLGTYNHVADSFHVYKRHFDLISKISGVDPVTKVAVYRLKGDKFNDIQCPKINGPAEVTFLRSLKFDNIPDDFLFTRWLIDGK